MSRSGPRPAPIALATGAAALVVVGLALALPACAAFDDGPPGRSCVSDRDCFRAQGEICDQRTLECGPSLDGGGVVDAAPAEAIDAAALDAAVAPIEAAP